MIADAPIERRAMLLEMAAFADFLVEQLPLMEQAWIARVTRCAPRASSWTSRTRRRDEGRP